SPNRVRPRALTRETGSRASRQPSTTEGLQLPLLSKVGLNATTSRTGWFRAIENHTTPPAFAGTPPPERRGMLEPVPLLPRRGLRDNVADGVVSRDREPHHPTRI